MENINIHKSTSNEKNIKEKKTRNIEMIKSYIISQPDKIKNLVNFYNRVINIFLEYISITQIYSNKLKELAIKVKLNEDEEDLSEVQLFNILKTILFFNSESLNEIINGIKNEMNLFNNEALIKTNELNNLSKQYFSEINKVILNQKKYEKEMKTYEELLINKEIKNIKSPENINNNNSNNDINNAKNAIISQENYFKSVKDSNNILKKIINISSEVKGLVREKINKKCNFILDTLIFFTKKQNENYELQKINIMETYSSNIHELNEEEELNNHFLHPLPYSLKCLDIYIKKKEKKEKRNSDTNVNNLFFSLITEINSEEDKKLKNKIRELKRDNILNIVDTITKNKIELSLRDEKIHKRETKRKSIKQILKYIIKDTSKYNEKERNKLFELLNEGKENIMYFFKILNNHRAKENNFINKETFNYLGEAFEYITKISIDKKDIEIFKLLFILSTTYSYKENNDKKYLFIYIQNFKEFKEKKFWENYFENFLNSEIENSFHNYGPQIGKNQKIEDIEKEKENKLKISLFSNLLMVVQNMIDFSLNRNFINEFIYKINDKYKLSEEELEQIKIYLDENKNVIDNNNNNEEMKIIEDKQNFIKNEDNNIINIDKDININNEKENIINIDKENKEENNINDKENIINIDKGNNKDNNIINFIDSD